jgi:deazaflavin-dependent oxidoreductase (nitroreductase family)
MSTRPHSLSSGVIANAGARMMRSRRLMRAPIWIYRIRAGVLFGSRLVMLEHIGRKSGETRYVVLEVLDHPMPDTYVVASGFGTAAQWFRNVQANSKVRVYIESRAPAPATARVLDQQAADRAVAAYRSRHPAAWARLKPVLGQTLGRPITDTNVPLPMVELRLDSGARS